MPYIPLYPSYEVQFQIENYDFQHQGLTSQEVVYDSNDPLQSTTIREYRTEPEVAHVVAANPIPRRAGGRGHGVELTLLEKNFVLASRQAYGRGKWAETEAGLQNYLAARHPDELSKLPYRPSRSLAERWHQSRRGERVAGLLEGTWRVSLDNEQWREERELIRAGGFLPGATWPADWERQASHTDNPANQPA
ncbi:hypothetical protein H072_9055 [Dactylellina haptotyla CBS 200.50]|uniref:Uncharacterized protein n=1 Tax=Dactylellina haptotyla (strain CBS 200.50) TaxID=1284197 RepID=S8A2U1_DACHA|nr:hypothetical protein H072_9055 [Dactylellina haptotyla CBS 200.50]